ncbi:DUF3501 family protein [bacterium]|nr:DUF3501 family protein [bacterium]
MRLVTREEILDYVTYEEQRVATREKVMKIKDTMRIRLGEYLTFLFENHDTIQYQIQEMVRIERIVKEKDIQHEIETYNEILGNPGDLGCTLLIEIDDPAERDVKLREWMGLPEKLYLLLASGEKVYARFDPKQVGDDRLSSVQYMQFEVKGRQPVAIGVEHAKMTLETPLTDQQQAALAEAL